MDIDPKPWLDALTWALANLPNLSLLLVIAAGAWVWFKDLWVHGREEGHHESWLQMVLRERSELGEENRKLRAELIQVGHRLPGGGEPAGPPSGGDGC